MVNPLIPEPVEGRASTVKMRNARKCPVKKFSAKPSQLYSGGKWPKMAEFFSTTSHKHSRPFVDNRGNRFVRNIFPSPNLPSWNIEVYFKIG